ncbi:MATE family efflux transporter [Haliangium sp.]|uniref:MATE family efflux transporter n=1 Tax=Haliangium sp. TaxID=2663208 RepID=UPI003D0C773F
MSRPNLLHGPVGPTLLRLAGPMVLGISAIILFNVVDTFYVGQLGAEPLAAMSFTFPVTFLVMSITMGLGIGTTSVIARAIGTGDRARVRRLTTHALILANLVVVLVAALGLMTMAPLFRIMGATDDLMPMIRAYMVPWFLGVGLLVIPMVGNSAIRATGDTKTPSYVMMVAGLVNVVFDPVLIFGVGPFPRLGIQGAAYATVISWAVTFSAAFWILAKRERMLELSWPRLGALLESWKQVLYIGLPAAGTNVLVPLSGAVLTRLVSSFGAATVAAYGVGNRLESVALIGILAMSTAVTPFVGQNYGASACDRVRAALRFTIKYALLYGAAMLTILVLLSGVLAGAFSDDPAVIAPTRLFLWIVPVSYGPLGLALLVNATFNAVNKPFRAAVLIGVRLFVLAVPLAFIGARVAGVTGLFVGIAVGNLLTGGLAYLMVRRFLRRIESREAPAAPLPAVGPTI